jgi:membrane protein YdbS with pleckstrin-like domain
MAEEQEHQRWWRIVAAVVLALSTLGGLVANIVSASGSWGSVGLALLGVVGVLLAAATLITTVTLRWGGWSFRVGPTRRSDNKKDR